MSRRAAPRADLIRLALSPDGEVLPDVRARAPGRGAWIGVPRAELETAQAKGKLKAALARAFKTGSVEAPADLAERIEAALKQGALDRLGLEAKAGHLLFGSERIEQAARAGKVYLLLHAADAAEDGRRKLDQAFRVGGGDDASAVMEIPASRAILSLALGRENVVHVAVVDEAAAARMSHWVGRWRAFLGFEAGSAGASAGPVVFDAGEGLE